VKTNYGLQWSDRDIAPLIQISQRVVFLHRGRLDVCIKTRRDLGTRYEDEVKSTCLLAGNIFEDTE